MAIIVTVFDATPSQARQTLTYCKTSSGPHYLLVHKVTCKEGRSVVHAIYQEKSRIRHTPRVMHVAGWTCRIAIAETQTSEYSIRCRRHGGDRILSGIRLGIR